MEGGGVCTVHGSSPPTPPPEKQCRPHKEVITHTVERSSPTGGNKSRLYGGAESRRKKQTRQKTTRPPPGHVLQFAAAGKAEGVFYLAVYQTEAYLRRMLPGGDLTDVQTHLKIFSSLSLPPLRATPDSRIAVHRPLETDLKSASLSLRAGAGRRRPDVARHVGLIKRDNVEK